MIDIQQYMCLGTPIVIEVENSS